MRKTICLENSRLVLYRLLALQMDDAEVRLQTLSELEWKEVLKLSASQGVAAVAFDSLQFLQEELRPPKSVLMQWLGRTVSVEQRAEHMQKVAFEYAGLLSEHGLKTFVMKGIGVGEYYPEPFHRECGDLDCFVLSSAGNEPAYEAANQFSEMAGASVRRGYYKHSHINYRGLTIENHQFCTAIRGGKEKKEFERHLETLLKESGEHPVGNSSLLMPCADFTALFLTAHSLFHFLFEKIHLRHVLDWAFFMKAEAGNVDWASFWNWCRIMHFTRFAVCLNWICRHKLGMIVGVPEPVADFDVEALSMRILEDIFSSEDCKASKKSHLKELSVKVKRAFVNNWKYADVYQHSALKVLSYMGWGYLTERKPEL